MSNRSFGSKLVQYRRADKRSEPFLQVDLDHRRLKTERANLQERV